MSFTNVLSITIPVYQRENMRRFCHIDCPHAFSGSYDCGLFRMFLETEDTGRSIMLVRPKVCFDAAAIAGEGTTND